MFTHSVAILTLAGFSFVASLATIRTAAKEWKEVNRKWPPQKTKTNSKVS